VDLPIRQKSGLSEALQVLEGVKGIATVRLGGNDVIRHKLVKAIIEAYEKNELQKQAVSHEGKGRTN
jgi:phosphate starvation-inducible PhoH-like protein